jgi:MFS family permease
VSASDSRKDRMREELAAHLVASFAEERGRLGDDREAAERALHRLGEPGALTRSLQDSVPWLERVFYTRLLPHRLETWRRRRRDETLRRYAIRMTSLMIALLAAGDLIVLPLAVAVEGGRPMQGREALAGATAQLVVAAAATFVFSFLVEAMVRALQGESSGRNRYRAALVAGLSTLVVVVLMLAFFLIATALAPHNTNFRRTDWPVVLRWVLPQALLAPVALFLCARDTISRRLRRDRWDLPEMPS